MTIAVILGNRMNDDGTISATMEKRLQLALRLNAAFKPDKIILSGGIANKKAGVAEAVMMYQYLVGKGIEQDKLIKEDMSHTTKENALYAVEIAKALGAKELIVCTTNEHVSRPYLNPIKLFEKQLYGTNIKLLSFTGN